MPSVRCIPSRTYFERDFTGNGLMQSGTLEQVLEKRKENGELGRTGALQAVLREAHGLFTLFYGSIRALLLKNPSGDIARSCLNAFLPDYLAGWLDHLAASNTLAFLVFVIFDSLKCFLVADFMSGKKLLMPSFQVGLQERETIQMMALERNTALEVQVNSYYVFLLPLYVFHSKETKW